MTAESRSAAAAEKASSLRAHDTFDCSQRRIVVLTPRVSEELMRYQHGEHRCGAPRAQGAWTEPISDEILFVQVLTLFNFDANVVQFYVASAMTCRHGALFTETF